MKGPFRNTGVRTRKQSRLAEIRAYVQERRIRAVSEADFENLLVQFAPTSDRALRKLLRESRLPLAPVVEGVRQDDFDQLERTLVAFTAEYQTAAGNPDRARHLRRIVITAKEHARFAAVRTKDEAQRGIKLEMAEWILLWLENPAIFPQWVRLRRGHSA
jgi:hypothetical protein